MAESESRHWWFVGRRMILQDTLKIMDLPKDAKILEIGCGTGGNLQMLADFGEVSALEMDANARLIAQAKNNARCCIKEGFCPDKIPFDHNRFDLICLFDVLEHIEQDKETLIALKPLLKHNGRIMITVPAYQWLFGIHDEFLHHKRRYSSRQLNKILTSSGYCKEKLSYFNMILFPLAVIIRFKDKWLNNHTASGSDIPPPFINTIFRQLFSLERFFLRYFKLPFGVSLLCVFRRSDKLL